MHLYLLLNALIPGVSLSAATGFVPKLSGLITLMTTLFVVIPVLHVPTYYAVKPTIDGHMVTPPPPLVLTLPPAPSKAFQIPLATPPDTPGPSNLDRTSYILLILAGAAAGAGIVNASKGGDHGNPPDPSDVARHLELPSMAALDTAKAIVRAPNAGNGGSTVREQPVAEDNVKVLPVDDVEPLMVDAEVLAGVLDDGNMEVLREHESSGVEMVMEADEDSEPSQVGETFLGLPDAVPVAAKADVEWREREIEVEDEVEDEDEAEERPEMQPEPVEYLDQACDENTSLEEPGITSGAAATDGVEDVGTFFEAPDSVPVDVGAASEDARSDGDSVLEESRVEAISEEAIEPGSDIEAAKENIRDLLDGADEEASIATGDAEEDAIPGDSLSVTVVEEEEEIEMPDEVHKRKLNAGGKRKSTEWLVFPSTDACIFGSDFANTLSFPMDGPVASSSKLPDAFLPLSKTESTELICSWLSESKVHDEVFREMERQGALGGHDGWTQLHTEPQREEQGVMATGEEDVDTVVDKDTSLVQDEDSTLADPFVAADQEHSFLPSTPAPYCQFNPSAPTFVPSATKKKLIAELSALPFWAPNMSPAIIIKPPPTAAEKRAAKLARRAARRAASLMAGDISGNGSSGEMSLFTVDDSLAGGQVHVGSLFRTELAQTGTGVRGGIENMGAGCQERGTSEVLPAVRPLRSTSLPQPLATSSPLNPGAIPFVPPTRPKRVEHIGLSFWNPVPKNPVPIVAPLKKKERRRLRALALQGSISLDL